jgi:CobQ-like glutamine amidotransferase family enzyme
MKNFTLTIGWLYPELMSTYGDRGNILVLTKRCEWRGINVHILEVTPKTTFSEMRKIDFIFGGGAQDREQEIVMRDLGGDKGKVIKDLIEKNIPALFVCGSPQLMGKYYEPAEGKVIKGLGIFDMETKHPGQSKQRLIGNMVAEISYENLDKYPGVLPGTPRRWIVGFENHGGRTYLGDGVKPFARVVKGFGNNGEDGTEGVVYKNAIGSYLHGPLLPKNPELADYIIGKALEVSFKEKVELIPLDDSLENKAKNALFHKLGLY